MLKLYRLSSHPKQYWEAWDNGDRSFTVHWGNLGTNGQSKLVKGGIWKNAKKLVDLEAEQMMGNQFAPIEELARLIIEFNIDGMGSVDDLEKRHRLQVRMDETLGWAGLGHCDGGSTGSGTMEVCCFVIDYELARNVVIANLAGTEFSGFSNIYREM